MSLPIVLQYGYVSVYGAGFTTGVSGVVPTNNKWLFGNIEQVSPYGINSQMAGSYIGCHVSFRQDDAQLALQYDNAVHTIISQNKLAGFSETPPPVLP